MKIFFFVIIVACSCICSIDAQSIKMFDLNKNNSESCSNPSDFIEFNNKLYFTAEKDGILGNRALWVYDGSNDPVIVDEENSGWLYFDFKVFKNKLYYVIDDFPTYKLMQYDGFNDPALMDSFTNFHSYFTPFRMAVFNNKLYYNDYDNSDVYSIVVETWEYDGVNQPVNVSNLFSNFFIYGFDDNVLYNNRIFTAGNNDNIWSFDGINQPYMVTDTFVEDNLQGVWTENLTVFNNKIYFTASDGISGAELWAYDGTNDPELVKDINTVNSSKPSGLKVISNKLYFSADDGIHGRELWAYDGINEPEMIVDLLPGGSSNPSNFTSLNKKIYFTAYDGIGYQLWAYEEADEPLMEKLNIAYDSASIPADMAVFNNKLYFPADDMIHGNELWVYCPETTSSITLAACNGYNSPSGKYFWTESGTYQDTILNAAGGDSVITINLTVSQNEVSVIQDGNILATNNPDAFYQWIDCGNGGTPIEGETLVAYTAEKNGSYAVIVDNGICIDTSDCYVLSGITRISDDFGPSLRIYPNPVIDKVYVELGKEYGDVKVKIKTISGELISSYEFGSTDRFDVALEGVYGVYIMEVYTKEDSKAVLKIIKN